MYIVSLTAADFAQGMWPGQRYPHTETHRGTDSGANKQFPPQAKYLYLIKPGQSSELRVESRRA